MSRSYKTDRPVKRLGDIYGRQGEARLFEIAAGITSASLKLVDQYRTRMESVYATACESVKCIDNDIYAVGEALLTALDTIESGGVSGIDHAGVSSGALGGALGGISGAREEVESALSELAVASITTEMLGGCLDLYRAREDRHLRAITSLAESGYLEIYDVINEELMCIQKKRESLLSTFLIDVCAVQKQLCAGLAGLIKKGERLSVSDVEPSISAFLCFKDKRIYWVDNIVSEFFGNCMDIGVWKNSFLKTDIGASLALH